MTRLSKLRKNFSCRRKNEKIRNLRNLRHHSGLDGRMYANYAKWTDGGIGKSCYQRRESERYRQELSI